MSSAQERPPSLNIHRFTSSSRIQKYKNHSKITKRISNNPSTDQNFNSAPHKNNVKSALSSNDKDSKEYLEKLVSRIFSRLNERKRGAIANGNTVENDNFEDYLPLLTSSSEIDLRLNALIGLILQNFVLSWYDRITDDYSNEFLREIVFVLLHLCRNLEERLRQLDYKELILDDLFVVFSFHLKNYKHWLTVRHSNLVSDTKEDDISMFNLLSPHVGICHQSEYLRQLSQNLLQRTLPHDIYDSELTSSILVTIVSEFGLKLTVEKLSEPYLLWEIIGKVCDLVTSEPISAPPASAGPRKSLVTNTIRRLSHIIAYATSVLSNNPNNQRVQSSNSKKPILQYEVFQFLSSFLNFVCRFPFLTLFLSIFSKFFALNYRLNHILHNLINNLLFRFLVNELFIVKILQLSRTILFPRDQEFYLEPRFIPTTEEELKELRNDTKDKILTVFDKYKYLKLIFYYENETLLDLEVTEFLLAFENKAINKHLVLRIVDVLFLRLFPDILQPLELPV